MRPDKLVVQLKFYMIRGSKGKDGARGKAGRERHHVGHGPIIAKKWSLGFRDIICRVLTPYSLAKDLATTGTVVEHIKVILVILIAGHPRYEASQTAELDKDVVLPRHNEFLGIENLTGTQAVKPVLKGRVEGEVAVRVEFDEYLKLPDLAKAVLREVCARLSRGCRHSGGWM